MNKLISLLTAALMVAMQTANAQRILTYEEYMKNVREKNIEYIVEKYEVSIAEANAQAAKVFPDPELSVSYEDYEDWDLETGRGYAAESTIHWNWVVNAVQGWLLLVANSR